MPRNVPGSKGYWKSKLLDVLAMSRELGNPNFFITLTFNDDWPELQTYIKNNTDSNTASTPNNDSDNTTPPVDYTVASIVAYMRRFALYRTKILQNKRGPFGKVTSFWWRHEFQKRGAIHTHMVIWCDSETIPTNCIRAQLPRGRFPNSNDTEFLNLCRSKCHNQLHQK